MWVFAGVVASKGGVVRNVVWWPRPFTAMAWPTKVPTQVSFIHSYSDCFWNVAPNIALGQSVKLAFFEFDDVFLSRRCSLPFGMITSCSCSLSISVCSVSRSLSDVSVSCSVGSIPGLCSGEPMAALAMQGNSLVLKYDNPFFVILNVFHNCSVVTFEHRSDLTEIFLGC